MESIHIDIYIYFFLFKIIFFIRKYKYSWYWRIRKIFPKWKTWEKKREREKLSRDTCERMKSKKHAKTGCAGEVPKGSWGYFILAYVTISSFNIFATNQKRHAKHTCLYNNPFYLLLLIYYLFINFFFFSPTFTEEKNH